jgi:hypothetical protein
LCHLLAHAEADLQAQYTNYKNTLQSLAQKIGEIEQDIDEHRYANAYGETVRTLYMTILSSRSETSLHCRILLNDSSARTGH